MENAPHTQPPSRESESVLDVILPVIDVRYGRVVRGAGGRREEYEPWHSPICPNARVAEAAAWFARAGWRDLYLADLDALEGGDWSLTAWKTVADAGLALWLDAGVADPASAVKLRERLGRLGEGHQVIVPLEKTASPESLAATGDVLGGAGVFSLDLQAGRPRCLFPRWLEADPTEIADAAAAARFPSMIVLDVAAVGSGGGVPTLELCKEIRLRHPDVVLTTGGGVRRWEDAAAARRRGVDRVLAASVLHSGALTPATPGC